MDKEVPRSPQPPPVLGYIQYPKRISLTMDKEAPPPPPPPPTSRKYVKPMCPLSHLTDHPHALLPKQGIDTNSRCFSCGEEIWSSSLVFTSRGFRYNCPTCDVDFHIGCHKFPKKLRHPYHPQHPLTFSFRNNESGIISDATIKESSWHAIWYSITSDPKKLRSVQDSRSQSGLEVDKCSWCAEEIEENWFYRCSICSFSLDLSCYKANPRQTIANPTSHHHPLVFYPRPLLTPCDACGLVNKLDPSYACFQCNYMVHQSCINLPRVIKITRHQHRLFQAPYSEAVTSPCWICYKKVDIKFGQYSCNQEDCSYVAHSKCATDENVWDGKELEWEPEKYDKSEDSIPFVKVGTNRIKHFSHEHLLKLVKYVGVRDGEKQCRACVLPINSRDFYYNCVKCNFFLHKVCAGLLRKIDHALHVHSLVLDPSRYSSPKEYYSKIGCSVCSRKFSGFKYKCSEEKCGLKERFQIDVRCTLVQDYFTHKSHEHSLFISTYKGKNKICCEGCKETCKQSYLQCSVCTFALCYQCATIPDEISYKYDKHPLSLCYGEELRDGTYYWCEVCEKKVNPKNWFYTCNECCITIHLQCVFGPSVYLMPGFTFWHYTRYWSMFADAVKVFGNRRSTRPLCYKCGHRCPSSAVYSSGGRKVTCSLECLEAAH